MSARPDVPRLAPEDLDLLISRSLDGDLSPEEEQQLERLVAADPAAARRKAELAALVAEVKALPEVAAPFAIATRVNANVAERGGRPGSLGGRVGFIPAPGFLKAALVVLALVGVAIALLRPAPKHLAEGPVDVLLYDARPAAPPPALAPAPAAPPAPATIIAEAKPDSHAEFRARRQEADGRANEVGKKQAGAPADALAKSLPKSEVAESNAPRDEESALKAEAETKPKEKAANLDRNDRDGGVVAQAPAKITASGSLAAPAERQAAARASAPAPAAVPAPAAARGWTVSVRGDAAQRWALRRAPDSYPAAAPGQAAVLFRVALDASGRVASARPVGTGWVEPGLADFVRGMLFEPLPQAVGGARDAKDAAAPGLAGSEIEIELKPR